jgi:hypothetical protein
MQIMKSKDLAYGAIAITLILVSFFIFRGMTNLVNCITVPLIFLFFTQGFDQRSSLTVATTVLLAVILLFPIQIIFILIELGMAVLLRFILRKRSMTQLLYPIIVTLLIIVGVVLTDMLFKTQINAFVLRISGGNGFSYILIFFIEGLIIAGIHYLFYHSIFLRLSRRQIDKSNPD